MTCSSLQPTRTTCETDRIYDLLLLATYEDNLRDLIPYEDTSEVWY